LRHGQQLPHLLRAERPIEHHHAADAARETDAARAVDDAADSEGTAGAVLGTDVDSYENQQGFRRKSARSRAVMGQVPSTDLRGMTLTRV
jgi:hypothetical protein